MEKKAIIIGASSGIGNTLARVMSAEGYTLGITGRRRNLLDELERALPGKTFVRDFDIVQTDTAMKALEKLISDMGGVDLIVINAGVGHLNPDLHWQKELIVLDVNVRGFAAMANVAFNYFKKQGKGQIVGISSLLALVGAGKSPAYSASKSFVSAYMDCLRRRANQLNLPLTVTDIKPGFIDTPMIADNPHAFWVSPTDKAAKQILRAIHAGRDHAYVTRRWCWIGWLMKILPDAFFTKF